MIPILRQQHILEYLKGRESANIADIVEKIGISQSTIRRDLKELEQQGEVEIFRGGGVQLKREAIELDLEQKLVLNREAKEKIAAYAASLIHPHDVIFIDPSSVNALLIDQIRSDEIHVITNSIAHINKLVRLRIPCTLIGGDIKNSTCSCVGVIAEQELRNFRFSKCFLGANGMSKEFGITNHDLKERQIKRIAIENSVTAYFLIDSSKYGICAMCKVSDMDKHIVITDKVINAVADLENVYVV